MGFREIIKQGEEIIEVYYLIPKAFDSEICKGMNKKLVKKILRDKSILILDSEGKNPKCSYTTPPGRRRVMLLIRNNLISDF